MRAISKLIPLYILSILIVSFLSLSQARAIQFDNPVLNQNLKWIKVAQDRSDFIIVGEILSVGKPQKSGNFQEVTYKILDVVNGKLPKRDMRQVTVKHYLSYRSRLQNPDLKKDELSPSLFSPGKRLIVMIQIETEKRFIGMLQKDSFEDVNSDFGTILYSEQNVKALRQLILDRALEILESHKSTSKYIFVGEVLRNYLKTKRRSKILVSDKWRETSMGRKKRMSTLWEVPDDLWEKIELILDDYDPPKETGRPRQDRRRIMDGLIFRFRTGCQWNHIPAVYGDDSTIHRTFQHWQGIGLFKRIWAVLVSECEELGKVDWQWQAADTVMGKARMGGDQIGSNPTDRAKNGTKRSMLTDAGGGPLAVVVAPANVHDTKLLGQTIEAIVVERPESTKDNPQHLCLDKAYDNPTGEQAVSQHSYQGHIRRIGEEKLNEERKKSILHGDG